MYFASQVFSGLTLDAVESHEIFRLDATSKLEVFSDNARSTLFQFSREILEVSAERDQSDSLKTIFEVYRNVAIPLRQDLTLRFSISARQLYLNSDAGRLHITLHNGTNYVKLSYVIGYKEKDWKQGALSYFFFQVGNSLNTWFNCERNVWNDLLGKNVTVGSSWIIISVTFGCISYPKEPSVNTKMGVFLNVSGTSLYYEKSNFIKVIPTIQVSWFAICEIISGMLLFITCSVILIRTRKQLKSNDKSF